MIWLKEQWNKVKAWWREALIATGIVGVAMAASVGGMGDPTLSEIQQAQQSYFQEHGQYAQVLIGSKPSRNPDDQREPFSISLPKKWEINVYEKPNGEWGYQVASSSLTTRSAKAYGPLAKEKSYSKRFSQSTTTSLRSVLPDVKGFRNMAITYLWEPLTAYALTDNTHSTDLEETNGEYWEIADGVHTGLDITGDLTIAMWINTESQPATDSRYTLASKYQGGGNERSWNFQYDNESGGAKLEFVSSADGSNVTEASLSQSFTNATWYHVAAVYDASNSQVELFVDGSSIGTGSASGSLVDSPEPFRIGEVNFGNVGSDQPFDGKIDDVRIWSSELTSTQVGNLHSSPCTAEPNSASLEGWWLFDNDGTDETTNNNDLTGFNTPTFSTNTAYSCAAAPTPPGQVIWWD